MRRFFIAIILTILSGLPVAAASAPELVVEKPAFDFGSIAQGKKVEHVFVLKNRGGAPLTIRNTTTSCGCTAATVSSPVIKPGQSGEIKTTFDSGNFSGSITKTVSVQTDDPKTPVYTLTIKGTVVEEIVVTPRQVNLGRLKPGEGREATVTVENRGNKKLQLTEVKTSLPQVAAKVTKGVIPPGGTGSVQISAVSRPGDRMLSGYLSIMTSNPSKPLITIPFFGSIVK